MTDRAPPGKTWLVERPGSRPRLIDFPDVPAVGWQFRGKEITMIDHSRGAFRTASGEFQFAEWRQWGADGQPE